MVLATPLIRPPLILQPSTPILPPVMIIARIHHHNRNRTTRIRSIVIRIRPRRRQVKATPAFFAAVGFAVIGQSRVLEELVVHGAGVESDPARGREAAVDLGWVRCDVVACAPLPGRFTPVVVPAGAGGALVSVGL